MANRSTNVPGSPGSTASSGSSGSSGRKDAGADKDCFSQLWDRIAFASRPIARDVEAPPAAKDSTDDATDDATEGCCARIRWAGGDEHPLAAGPYLHRRQFWHVALVSIIMSGFISVFGLGYNQVGVVASSHWQGKAFQDAVTTKNLHGFGAIATGEWNWMGYFAITGLAIGVVRWLTSYPPEGGHGVIHHLQVQTVGDFKEAWVFSVLVLIGQIGASPLGPEAGLVSISCGVAEFLGRRLRASPEVTKELFTTAMSAGWASLFPSPLIAVAVVDEAGAPAPLGARAAKLMLNSIAAVMSFMVFVAVFGRTYIATVEGPVTPLYNVSNMGLLPLLLATLIGLLSSATIVVLGFSVHGLCWCTRAVRHRLDALLGRPSPADVLFGLLGGACLGLLAVACPLTLGDGQFFVTPLIYSERTRAGLDPAGIRVVAGAYVDAASAGDDLGAPTLIITLLAKLLAFAVAVASGYEGGICFAAIYIGTLLGLLVWIGTEHAGVPVLDPHACAAIGAAAMMSGTMKVPVSAIVISMVVFQLVGDMTCLLIASVTVVSLLLDGTGVMNSLQMSNPCKGPLA